MRTRIPLVVCGLVLVIAAAVALVVVVVDGSDGPTADDRAALAAAGSDPLDDVLSLAADADRWGRLVAGGGTDLAALLDAAQPALGLEPDPAALVGPVVAPFVDDEGVDDEVVLALGRWTWPLLATDLGADGALDRAGAVIARADDEREAVTGAVLLARLHRTLTGSGDRAEVAQWRSQLAGAAVSGSPPEDDDVVEERAGALRSGDLQDQPAAMLRGVLAAWGRPGAETRPTDPARAAIAATEEAGLTSAGSAITIASYLVVIDRTEDDDAAAVVERLASGEDPLTSDDAGLTALEDALLNVDDPALAPATETATLLRTA